MKKVSLAIVILILLALGIFALSSVQTKENGQKISESSVKDKKVEQILPPATPIEKIPAPTTTATSTPKVSAKPAETTAAKKPSEFGILYSDPVAKFSLSLPYGWTHKVTEHSATSSIYSVEFAPSAEIQKEIPEPLMQITSTDLARSDLPDYEENMAVRQFIEESGPDAFINQLIDEVFAKQWNAFKILSAAKRDINGKIFFEISATYISEKSGEDVTLLYYIYVGSDKLVSISISSYAYNWPKFKNQITQTISTLKI